MNKNKFSLTALLLMTLSLVSCHDDLLHPVPESILTTANAFTTATDIDLAVLGAYNSLQSRLPTDYELLEIASDNMYGAYFATAPGITEIQALEVSPENPKLNSYWKSSYNGIFRANTVLANIDNPENYAAGEREQYIGEAKFLRAKFYFDLVRVFGGVPKVTSIIPVSESREIPRASEADIYSLIVEDLEDAISKLPSDMISGRTSKGAAIALLSKVHIYLKDYGSAKSYLEQLFSDFNYSLVSDFGDLFKEETEQNSESIFSVTYVSGTNGHGMGYAHAAQGGIYQVITSGMRVGRPTWDLHTAYDPEDTRFEATITERYLAYESDPSDEPTWYPFFSKWVTPVAVASSSGLDIPVLRLGDMILLYAEVLYFLDQPQAALDQINLVRERAFGNDMHNYTLADIPDQEAFLDILLLERRLELAVENNRWFDLVRTGRFTTTLTTIEGEYNPSTEIALPINKNAQAYMKYFPIPYEQVQLSAENVIEQNDGY